MGPLTYRVRSQGSRPLRGSRAAWDAQEVHLGPRIMRRGLWGLGWGLPFSSVTDDLPHFSTLPPSRHVFPGPCPRLETNSTDAGSGRAPGSPFPPHCLPLRCPPPRPRGPGCLVTPLPASGPWVTALRVGTVAQGSSLLGARKSNKSYD